MKKLILLMFVLFELVVGIQIFVNGLPSFMDAYVSALFLLFLIFNIILFGMLIID